MTLSELRKGMVLLAHGARHPEWASPFQRMRQLLIAKQPDLLVELAFLSFMPPDLPTAIDRLAEQGADTVTVVPLFMGQSGHVLRDLPPMMEQARQTHQALLLRLADAAGEDEDVLEALVMYCLGTL
ncbi:MAG: CbiX/SirB N-terminal domain-containing protein [Burkholderiaceae bacterium]|jgi:sirohydrochlorin cobaltochelatase|nr:CbiX/SirB N-terminal domain-containing protein [Burkholderiaceae bacterium]